MFFFKLVVIKDLTKNNMVNIILFLVRYFITTNLKKIET